MLDAIHNLSAATLRSLAASLRNGPLAVGVSRHALAQIIGSQAAAVHGNLEELQQQGLALAHIALLLETIAQSVYEKACIPQRMTSMASLNGWYGNTYHLSKRSA